MAEPERPAALDRPLPHDAEVVLDVVVAAPAARVWDAVTDWDRQGEWMVGTTVRSTGRGGDGAGRGVGAGLEAFTGVGRVGVVDTMVVTRWEPPRRCEVLHTGRVVRGTGGLEVLELPGDRSRLVWSEQLVLPLGRLGRLGFLLVAPLVSAGVKLSLARLGRAVEAEATGG